MEITHARTMKNMLNQVFDTVTADNFCGGMNCEDCILKRQGKQCIPNVIQELCASGMSQLNAHIAQTDKCSNNQLEEEPEQ